jgi:transposase
LNALDGQIEELTRESAHAAHENDQAVLLMTAPAVGPIVALTFIAKVGDIGRFSTYRYLCSYLGLIPRLDASGGKDRCGRITKEGPAYLRSLLVEAAHVIGRCKNSHLHSFYWKMALKKDRKRAAVWPRPTSWPSLCTSCCAINAPTQRSFRALRDPFSPMARKGRGRDFDWDAGIGLVIV